MCGRYLRRSDKQRIAEAFHLSHIPDDFVLPPWDYNVAPTTHQPVIRHNRHTAEREVVLMRWGLIPSFAKSLADFKPLCTINARAESLLSSSTWRTPFLRRRCLIPADGFYEWALILPDPPCESSTSQPSRPRPRKAKLQRQPYAFSLRSGAPFAFAGLWDAWKNPDPPDPARPDWLQSFSIITTTPNELTAQVHTRMPVILHPRDYDRWVTRPDPAELPPRSLEVEDPSALLALLRPYPAEQMSAQQAHADVGNVRNNHPGLLNSA